MPLRMALMNPRALASEIEQSVGRRLQGAERGARTANIDARVRQLNNMDPAVGAQMVVDRMPAYVAAVQGAPEDRRQTIRGGQVENAMSGLRDGNHADYAARMNRGPLGGERGVMESAARFANRDSVRQGGLVAAGLGATVGTGALLTEGAQQLMTLMQFLQHGQEVEERAERSPLV